MKKFWGTVFTNLTIVCMLSMLCVLSFTGGINAVFNPNAENVYYRGDTSKQNVTLMINVYWGNEYLPTMLNSLKEYGVTTTFFVGGLWVSKYPELLMQISDAGHEIGNHGYFHKDQDKLNYVDNQKEIMNNHKIVKEYLKKDMTVFAPPSGAFNSETISAAVDLGYKVIMWSRDTVDWRDKDADVIYSRATKNLGNGELVLMHPTAETAKALPKILQYCKDNNLKVVTVSENIVF